MNPAKAISTRSIDMLAPLHVERICESVLMEWIRDRYPSNVRALRSTSVTCQPTYSTWTFCWQLNRWRQARATMVPCCMPVAKPVTIDTVVPLDMKWVQTGQLVERVWGRNPNGDGAVLTLLARQPPHQTWTLSWQLGRKRQSRAITGWCRARGQRLGTSSAAAQLATIPGIHAVDTMAPLDV